MSKAKALGLTSKKFYIDELDSKTLDIILDVKKKHKPELNKFEWGAKNFYDSNMLKVVQENIVDTIERVHYKDISVEDFNAKFQDRNIPCIIKGLTKNWDSYKFDWKSFYKRYKNAKFKVGEDNDGKTLRIKFKHYMKYIVTQKDDCPLYLFESGVEKNKDSRHLIESYSVPKYFKEDLFKIMGAKNRPPYRWFLIGPERSGTTIHYDPLMTSAWNTSLQGRKLWVMFPFEVPKFIAKGMDYEKKFNNGKTQTALEYFYYVIPEIKKNEKKDQLKIIECIQYPGETIFVPGGWWHAVVNLDDTMAVTQNFMSTQNFDNVWINFRYSRKKLSEFFQRLIKKKNARLYDRAIFQNKRDNFLMPKEKPGPSEVKFENDISTTTQLSSLSSSSSSSSSYTLSNNSSESSRTTSSSSSSRSPEKNKRKKDIISFTTVSGKKWDYSEKGDKRNNSLSHSMKKSSNKKRSEKNCRSKSRSRDKYIYRK